MPILAAVIFFAIMLRLAWSDVRHDVLPDNFTLGGVVVGLVLSEVFPQMHGQNAPLWGFLASLFGAVAGYALGWLYCEIGKMIFGTKTHKFPEGCGFKIIVDD